MFIFGTLIPKVSGRNITGNLDVHIWNSHTKGFRKEYYCESRCSYLELSYQRFQEGILLGI